MVIRLNKPVEPRLDAAEQFDLQWKLIFVKQFGWTLSQVNEEDYEELLQIMQWMAEDSKPKVDNQGQPDDPWLAQQRQQYQRLKHRIGSD